MLNKITCVVIFSLLSLKGMSTTAAKSKFAFSYEKYHQGSNHFEGTSYLFLNFKVEEMNEHHYKAILKNGVISEWYSSGYGNKFRYYETVDPSLNNDDFYWKDIVAFLEKHPVFLSFQKGEVVLENLDSLQNGFELINKKELVRRTKTKPNGNKSGVTELKAIFQHMFFRCPADLLSSGDMALEKGVVYNYQRNFGRYKQIEITDIKKHEKSNLFVQKESDKIRYKRIQSVPDIEIISIIPEELAFQANIKGTFPNDPNKEIKFTVKADSPLVPGKDYFVKTDSDGGFSLTVDTEVPATVQSDNGHLFYVEPGDELSFTSNATQDSLIFFGIGADNNNFLQAESRLEKLGELDRSRSRVKQNNWFQRIDRSYDAYFRLLENYQTSLSPRFYEAKFLDCYFGKINRKLEYYFGVISFSTRTNKLERDVPGLDTIPEYQSFVYSKTFNKYLENSLLLSFEKLRGFVYIRSEDQQEAPSKGDMVWLMSLSQKGKILRDFLEYMAPVIYLLNSEDDIEEFQQIVRNNFGDSELEKRISSLRLKNVEVKVGDQFPPVELRDLNNEVVELSQFRGKVVYIMFWRNDALVLEREWEKFHQLASEMDGQRVEFVNVAMEEDFERWKGYVGGMDMNSFSLFVDRKSEEFQKYFSGLRSRHYFLIDMNGKVIDSDGPYPSSASLQISQNMGMSRLEKILLAALATVAAALFILTIIWLISRSRRNRRAKIKDLTNRLRETELKAIKAQMNPHFLFNSLNSIQNLINQHEVESANKYLSRFARLLRAVLQYSEKEYVPISDEIDTLTLYVQLERLRFNFDFEVDIDPAIDIHNTFIPPLLLQPFIENAILHGLQLKKGDKTLVINIAEENGRIICLVKDNGVGIESTAGRTNKHNGMGNKLSLERINLLNQKNNSNFKLEVAGAEKGGEGTEVRISFNSNLI